MSPANEEPEVDKPLDNLGQQNFSRAIMEESRQDDINLSPHLDNSNTRSSTDSALDRSDFSPHRSPSPTPHTSLDDMGNNMSSQDIEDQENALAQYGRIVSMAETDYVELQSKIQKAELEVTEKNQLILELKAANMEQQKTQEALLIHSKRLSEQLNDLMTKNEATHQREEALLSSLRKSERHVQELQTAIDESTPNLGVKSGEQALAISLERLGAENTKLRSELDTLRSHSAEVERLRNERDYLKRELNSRDAELDAVRQHATLSSLASKPASSDTSRNKISDDEIVRKWGSLSYSIDNLTSLCQRELHSDMALFRDETIAQYTERIATRIPSNRIISMVFVESWFWVKLMMQVFRQGALAWAGPAGAAFAELCGAMKEGSTSNLNLDANYHEWRVETACYLAQILAPSHTTRVSNIVDDMFSTFRELVPEKKHPIFRSQLQSAVSNATEIDLLLRQSKAMFKVSHSVPRNNSGGQSILDEESMDCRNLGVLRKGNRVPIVDLIISPRLTKRGTADGEQYEVQSTLIKLEVMCDLFPDKTSRGPGRPRQQQQQQQERQERKEKGRRGSRAPSNPRKRKTHSDGDDDGDGDYHPHGQATRSTLRKTST